MQGLAVGIFAANSVKGTTHTQRYRWAYVEKRGKNVMINAQMHGGLTTTHDGLHCQHEIGHETGSSHRQTLDASLLKLQVSRCTDPDPPRRRCADGAALLVLPFLMLGHLMIWPEPAFSDTSTVKFKPGGPPPAGSNDKRPDIMYGVYSPFVPGPEGKCVVGFLPEVKGGVPSCRPTSLQAAQREATRMIDSARQAATSSAREGMRREQASQQRAANKYKTDAAANKYETEKDRAPASTSAEPSPATTLSAPTPAAGEPAAPAAAKKEAAGSKDSVPAAAKKEAAVSKDYALFERKRILLEAREAQSQMKQKITAVSEADIYRTRNKERPLATHP
jgi:hypothetical protein